MSVSVDTKAGVPQVPARRLHDPAYRGFASDNYAGAHAEIIEAVQAANEGHVTAYGEDVYTAALQVVIKSHFGAAATAYPVFNGTGANVLALQALLPRWGAAIQWSAAVSRLRRHRRLLHDVWKGHAVLQPLTG